MPLFGPLAMKSMFEGTSAIQSMLAYTGAKLESRDARTCMPVGKKQEAYLTEI